MPTTIRSILFDLDGTLLDTAPDLAAALNRLRAEQGLSPLPYERIRPVVSHGAAALVKRGFAIDEHNDRFEPLRQRLLELYAEALHNHTVLFEGMSSVLEHLESEDYHWGIVTNKPTRFTEPLLQELALATRSACVVCGDTLTERKPSPAPLLHACSQLGSQVNECVYIGDALRDIEAGRAAGMTTLVAAYGYLDETDQPHEWGADGILQNPPDLLTWLEHNRDTSAGGSND